MPDVQQSPAASGARPSTTVQPSALGERKLTTVHAIGQSLAIGPIFSAGLLTSLIAAQAGWNTPLSTLLGMIGVLCLAYVVALYARRYAGAGAIYEYLTRGGNRDVGVFAAGAYTIGLLFLGAGGVFIGIGFLTNGFFAAHLSSIDIPWWVWGCIAVFIPTALNHFGVRLAVRGVIALATISAIPFVILVVAIFLDGGHGHTLSVFDPGQTSIHHVFFGILFAVTLFIGFEAAASLGEETENPKRSIPVAAVGSVALCGIFYLFVTYAMTIGFGKAGIAAWGGGATGPGTLATQYVGKWLSTIIDLVIILDAISLSIAFVVGCSRVIFALSRDGLLPKPFATTTRNDTPLGANAVIVVAGLLFVLWAGVTHYGDAVKLPNEFQAFLITASAGSFLIELVYFLLAIFAFRLALSSGPGAWWRTLVVLVAAATPVAAYYGALHPWPTYPNNRGIIFTIVCVVIALLWVAYEHVRHPDRVRNAAAHAETHHGVAPLDETLDYEPGSGPEPVIGPAH
jgi:amino acid transporter